MKQCDVSLGGVPVTVESLDFSDYEFSAAAPLEPMTFTCDIQCATDDMLAFFRNDFKPPELETVVTHNTEFGTLTTWIERAGVVEHHVDENGVEMTLLGFATRMRLDNGRTQTAWDPRSVQVSFCGAVH